MSRRTRDTSGLWVMRVMLTIFFLGSGLLTLHRPSLVEEIYAYHAYVAVMPTAAWGAWLGMTGLLLLLFRPGSALHLLASISSIFVFAWFAVLVSGTVGLNFGTVLYGALTWGCTALLQDSATTYLMRRSWYTRFKNRINCPMSDVTKDGSLIGIGGVVLGLLAAFLKPLISGSGAQEKELRESLVSRVDALEARMKILEAENEAYRMREISQARAYMYLLGDRERVRRQRDSLRVEVNDLRLGVGKVAYPWLDDPADPA